jgi:hypothetical protein
MIAVYVSYRCTYRIEGAVPFETKCSVNSAGMEKYEFPAHGTVTMYDWVGGRQFKIDNDPRDAAPRYHSHSCARTP